MSGTVEITPATLPAYIGEEAPAFGLDPAAVLAVAAQEGLGGGIGDQGTSFGPWQLHAGGALPASEYGGPNSTATQAWAWSTDGINFALKEMAADGARGLVGGAAIDAIVSRFERPANVPREEQDAQAAYVTYGGDASLATGSQAPSAANGGVGLYAPAPPTAPAAPGVGGTQETLFGIPGPSKIVGDVGGAIAGAFSSLFSGIISFLKEVGIRLLYGAAGLVLTALGVYIVAQGS